MMDLFVLRLRFEVLFGFLISLSIYVFDVNIEVKQLTMICVLVSTLICVLIIVYSFGLMRIELKSKIGD